MNAAIIVAVSVIIGIPVTRLADRNPEFGCWLHGSLAVISAVAAVLVAVHGEWRVSAVPALGAVINGFLWRYYRRRRRKRRKALAAMGAKSRARIAAMVGRLREHKPRPVLRPVPLPS